MQEPINVEIIIELLNYANGPWKKTKEWPMFASKYEDFMCSMKKIVLFLAITREDLLSAVGLVPLTKDANLEELFCFALAGGNLEMARKMIPLLHETNINFIFKNKKELYLKYALRCKDTTSLKWLLEECLLDVSEMNFLKLAAIHANNYLSIYYCASYVGTKRRRKSKFGSAPNIMFI
jgi:hypothetical protein